MRLFRTVLLSSVTALITAFFPVLSFGQNLSPSPPEELQLVFDHADFNGQFSVMAAQNGDYDYYVVDMTRLHDRFEKVYFMNLVYRDDKLISIEADPDKDQLWFKAYRTNPEQEITCLFDDLHEETSDASLKMDEESKLAWLQKHDKFIKK